MMNAVITRFNPEQAKAFDGGSRAVCGLVPDGETSGPVFHWVRVSKNVTTKLELDVIKKTFLIFDGQGIFEVDGVEMPVRKGDALWIPQGAHHLVKTAACELQYIVVKADQ